MAARAADFDVLLVEPAFLDIHSPSFLARHRPA